MTQLEEAGAPNPPYMVNLFASWCTPCLAELPYLKQWKEASGLPVIGIAWKDDPEKLQQWVERHAPPFDVIYEDTEGRATAPLAIKGLPVSYLVDKDGVIRGMHAGAVTASDVTELTKILR
jgi:cytochrome c biogenesis protein CcmG/thiol:disulfide interchange protein DsbE